VRTFAESVNGQTLVDLVEQSPFKPFDTIKVCYRLCELGLIAKRDPVRSISPLTAQLAVRDWLLGTAAAQPKATVTEAGRRAAEAYAEAAAARAKAEPMPSDELFEQPVPLGQPARGAPAVTVEDVPTSPREVNRGPRARNKSKGEKAAQKDKPSKEPIHKQAVHKEPGHKHESVLAKPEVAKPPAPKHEPPPEMHMPAATFDDVDEAFFASESELAKVDPVDTFDDLDQTDRKRRVDKKWSLFGDKPAPKPTGKKKR